jgi:hypothetical protein
LKQIAGGVLSGTPKLPMNRPEGKSFFQGAERGIGTSMNIAVWRDAFPQKKVAPSSTTEATVSH